MLFGRTLSDPVHTYQLLNNSPDNLPYYIDTDSHGDDTAFNARLDVEEGVPVGIIPLGDSDNDGIDDAINASYSDPDGDINDPQNNLQNQSGDNSEVGFREPNSTPIVDLNSTATEADTDRDYVSTFVEDGGSVGIADVAADIEDQDLSLIHI